MFETVQELSTWVAKKGSFKLASRPKKLTQEMVSLQSAASGDFNPAHCSVDFAKYSIFGAIVSQGIGTIARGEAEFLQLLQFAKPVETIALGYRNINYKTALYVGDVYWYEFSVSNFTQKKKFWVFDCHIVCKAISIGKLERVVAEADWIPAFVPPGPEVPEDKLDLLRMRSYRYNLVHEALPVLAAFLGKRAASALLVVILLCTLLAGFWWGFYKSTQQQMKSFCKDPQLPCYVGTGP